MLDSTDLVRIIKQAAVEAVEASKPADIVFGTVLSETPLKVKTDQKLFLSELQLAVAERLSDRQVEIVINGETHTGSLKNALKVGDRVMLFKRQGGQQYIVTDRVV